MRNKFLEFEIIEMKTKIKSYGITIQSINKENKVFLVKINGLLGSISFEHFNQDLQVFMDNYNMLYGIQLQSKNEIFFDESKFKEGILNAQCTCGGKVTREYDGELTENYYFTCECGSKEVLCGYWLDTFCEW